MRHLVGCPFELLPSGWFEIWGGPCWSLFGPLARPIGAVGGSRLSPDPLFFHDVAPDRNSRPALPCVPGPTNGALAKILMCSLFCYLARMSESNDASCKRSVVLVARHVVS